MHHANQAIKSFPCRARLVQLPSKNDCIYTSLALKGKLTSLELGTSLAYKTEKSMTNSLHVYSRSQNKSEMYWESHDCSYPQRVLHVFITTRGRHFLAQQCICKMASMDIQKIIGVVHVNYSLNHSTNQIWSDKCAILLAKSWQWNTATACLTGFVVFS